MASANAMFALPLLVVCVQCATQWNVLMFIIRSPPSPGSHLSSVLIFLNQHTRQRPPRSIDRDDDDDRCCVALAAFRGRKENGMRVNEFG
uniref:Putative secreted protein n=1 Tax=Anopheles triannulatus TaxID=58253 RepID=A0A2M4B719_9DIPT